MKEASTKSYYDDFSAWYEKERHHGYHAMLDSLELNVLRTYAAGKDVLEVGCGTGLIMDGVRPVCRSLVGVDLSQGMLFATRRRDLQAAQASATALPFAEASFDVTYSFKVLAHVEDIEVAMAEMARVTRPGGYVLAEFYNRHSLRYAAKRLSRPGKISTHRTEAEVFTRWDTAQDIEGYLPPSLTVERWRGVRVLTPAAAVFKLPSVDKVLPRLEHLASRSFLTGFGGFLVAVCRKRMSLPSF